MTAGMTVQAAHGEGLGNSGSNAYPIVSTRERRDNWQATKYSHAAAAGEILGSDWAVSQCMKTVKGGAENVTVQRAHHADGSCGHAHYSGLMTCGSVWVCPICANKILTQRAGEIERAVGAVTGLGFKTVLITYTIQHRRRDALSTLLDDLKAALRYMRSGAAHKRFRDAHGVVGYIRAVEVRWGKVFGWHPHAHELLIVRDDADMDALRADLCGDDPKNGEFGRYGNWLKRHGYHVTGHTVDVRTNDDAQGLVQEYLTKTSVQLEMTNNEGKQAKSLSPFMLLDAYKQTGAVMYAELFREYAHATKGKRMHTWSRGLRDLAGLEPELTDEQLAEMPEDEGESMETLAILHVDQWKRVVRFRLRAELLNIADRGDRFMLAKWLAQAGIVTDDEMDDFLRRTNRQTGTRGDVGSWVTPEELDADEAVPA